MAETTTGYTVTDYLLDRLAEAGVRRLYGVPGDFTLAMLDHVSAHPLVEWVGCANELGAGYAADGYARMAGLGAVCTTFGVGELSAINAIAGAYAEHVPVVHIVGSPATTTQTAARATHHTLGDGDFRRFARMTREVTASQGELTVENAVSEIDRVLAETLERRLPGYLLIPADVGLAPAAPPAEPLRRHPGVTDAAASAAFAAAVRRLLSGASTVSVLADIMVQRMGAVEALRAVLRTGVPFATLLWGRRVVNESAPNYLGPYVGAVSDPGVRSAIEDADALISAGVLFTDLTSGFFSQSLPAERTVDIDADASRIGDETFAPLAMTDALRIVAEELGATARRYGPSAPAAPADAPPAAEQPGSDPLDQAALWREVAAFLRPGDLVLADQGTAFYGIGSHRLPEDVTFIGQPLWAAIGYTLPALLGAAGAAPERRPVVLIGDGAAQLTAAELGTLIRNRVPATVVLVDNDGYTVERAIHGPEASYNDIASWDWTKLVTAFDDGGFARGIRASTPAELRAALADAAESELLTVIVATVPRLDVPPLLASLAAAAAAANRRG